MNEAASKGAAAIWHPPAPSTGREGVRWQRVLSIGAVVAIHIVGIVMFAAKPLGFRLPGMDSEAQNVVYLAPELAPAEAAQPACPRIPRLHWRATRTGGRAVTSCRHGWCGPPCPMPGNLPGGRAWHPASRLA